MREIACTRCSGKGYTKVQERVGLFRRQVVKKESCLKCLGTGKLHYLEELESTKFPGIATESADQTTKGASKMSNIGKKFSEVVKYIETKNLDKARKLLSPILHENRNDPRALFLMGMVQSQSGNFSGDTGAVDCFSRVIKLDASKWQAYYLLGLAKERLGDNDGAAAAYRETLKIKPDYAHAIDRLDKLDSVGVETECTGVRYTEKETNGEGRGATSNIEERLDGITERLDDIYEQVDIGRSDVEPFRDADPVIELEERLDEIFECEEEMGDTLDAVDDVIDLAVSKRDLSNVEAKLEDLEEEEEALEDMLEEVDRLWTQVLEDDSVALNRRESRDLSEAIGDAYEELSLLCERIASCYEELAHRPEE